jgi:hypothetical protein
MNAFDFFLIKKHKHYYHVVSVFKTIAQSYNNAAKMSVNQLQKNNRNGLKVL